MAVNAQKRRRKQKRRKRERKELERSLGQRKQRVLRDLLPLHDQNQDISQQKKRKHGHDLKEFHDLVVLEQNQTRLNCRHSVVVIVKNPLTYPSKQHLEQHHLFHLYKFLYRTTIIQRNYKLNQSKKTTTTYTTEHRNRLHLHHLLLLLSRHFLSASASTSTTALFSSASSASRRSSHGSSTNGAEARNTPR